MAISGGNITATVSISPVSVVFNSDGSFYFSVNVSLNTESSQRTLSVSADGTTFALDGVAVGSPPLALQALGAHLSAMTPKITTAFSAPGMITLLTS